jgi:hypothetical protein
VSKKKIKPPICPYCSIPAVLIPDSQVYRKSYGSYVWNCDPCKAWVGVHRGSPRYAPLGRLATAELRALKVKAHAAFDAYWQAAISLRGWTKTRARYSAYKWLSEQLGIEMGLCHIGMFDEATTQRVIDVCAAQKERKA